MGELQRLKIGARWGNAVPRVHPYFDHLLRVAQVGQLRRHRAVSIAEHFMQRFFAYVAILKGFNSYLTFSLINGYATWHKYNFHVLTGGFSDVKNFNSIIIYANFFYVKKLVLNGKNLLSQWCFSLESTPAKRLHVLMTK